MINNQNQEAARSEFIRLCMSEVSKLKKKTNDRRNIHHYSQKQHKNQTKSISGKNYLTPRELQCVKLVVSGKTTKQIGNILSLSHRTVEYYLQNVRKKAKCHNKRQLIHYASHNNLINDIDIIDE